MIRGIQTLRYKRHLMNPLRYGRFAWMLFSHKVCRWMVPWALLAGLVGMGLLANDHAAARAVTGLALAGILVGGLGWLWPENRPMPRLLALPTFALAANVAALVAVVRSFRGELNPIWEPTRREQQVKSGAGLEMSTRRVYH